MCVCVEKLTLSYSIYYNFTVTPKCVKVDKYKIIWVYGVYFDRTMEPNQIIKKLKRKLNRTNLHAIRNILEKKVKVLDCTAFVREL